MGLHACREGGREGGRGEKERERERERGALTIRHKHSSLDSLRVGSKVDTHGTCIYIRVGNTVLLILYVKEVGSTILVTHTTESESTVVRQKAPSHDYQLGVLVVGT